MNFAYLKELTLPELLIELRQWKPGTIERLMVKQELLERKVEAN